ncbi:MAG: manganese transporter [Zetaproteobacteria bacterium]|nr:MAG: manganese transporter [Zetaproteobacteria bacterium]
MDILTNLLTEHYNATIVFMATALLGLSAGLVGCFLVLRKQALISDAVTHATLPGIGIGFILSLQLGLNDGKFLPLLLLCSAATAYLGARSVQYITNNTRLSPDTAIASVMSFFYGLGLLLLSIIQNIDAGNKAGLNSFLLGQVSGLRIDNLILLGAVSLIVVCLVILNFKNLRLLCFDKNYASLLGLKIKATENLLLLLMILVICTGLKTVGLIMIIALLIIPAITARLWTDRSEIMAALAAFFGAISCIGGVYISSALYDLPTGSTIVLFAFSLFTVSLIIRIIRGTNV